MLADRAALAAERTPGVARAADAQRRLRRTARMPLDREPRLVRNPRGPAHSRRHRQLPDARRRMEQEPRHERRAARCRGQTYTAEQYLPVSSAPTTSTRHATRTGTTSARWTTTPPTPNCISSRWSPAATPGAEGDAYRASFLRGIRYCSPRSFPTEDGHRSGHSRAATTTPSPSTTTPSPSPPRL